MRKKLSCGPARRWSWWEMRSVWKPLACSSVRAWRGAMAYGWGLQGAGRGLAEDCSRGRNCLARHVAGSHPAADLGLLRALVSMCTGRRTLLLCTGQLRHPRDHRSRAARCCGWRAVPPREKRCIRVVDAAHAVRFCLFVMTSAVTQPLETKYGLPREVRFCR